MTTYLITAANSDISIGIARILKHYFPQDKLIGVAPDGHLPAAHFFDQVYHIPLVSDPEGYKNTLENIIATADVDVLCPISESELQFYLEADYKPIKNILINPPSVLTLFLDKYETSRWLASIHVPVPETSLLRDAYPQSYGKCIVKPKRSAGSKNMYLVDSKIMFDAIQYTHQTQADDFVIQRCVGSIGDEYTCALWRYQDDYRSLILKRKLQGGLTGEAEVVQHVAIQDTLNKIERNIQGNFFINVQCRLENGIPFVFEINPRFSSTIMLRHKVGFQDVLWSFLALLDNTIPSYSPPLTGVKLFRIADELIINV